MTLGYRIRAKIPTLGFLATLVACSGGPTTREGLREHCADMDIVLALLDAAAADHFLFLGYERDTTPFLSELAEEAVVFENAYAQASATPLSIYSLFTGSYPLVEEFPVLDGEIQVAISKGTPTLASRLARTHPQRLALSGNRWITPELGYAQGFGEFQGTWEMAEDLSRSASLLSDRAIEWLQARAPSPSLLYLHYLEPHLPYAPPEPFASIFDAEHRGFVECTAKGLAPYRARKPTNPALERNIVGLYDGNLAYVDSEIERVVRAIGSQGRWDRTIFVLLSDHGEAFWQHGMRGHGKGVWEEMIRVPLVIRVPGLPARRVPEPVQLVDLLPTLVELSGNPRADAAGQSLLPLLLGDASEEDQQVFSRNHEVAPVEFALRERQWKWVRRGSNRNVRLFDLSTDPTERLNLQSHRDPVTKERTTPLVERFAARLDSLILSQAGISPAADVDTLDAAARERLRAMGYFH